MTNQQEFQERFAYFKKQSDKYLENNLLLTDLSTSHFIRYLTSIGYFLDSVYDSIPASLLEKIYEIYSQIALSLANDDHVKDNLAKSFEETEVILKDIFQIESISKKYNEEPPEIRKLRWNLIDIIKDNKAAEIRRKKENKDLLDMMESIQYQQSKNILTQVQEAISKIDETSSEFKNLSKQANDDAKEIEDLRKRMVKEIEDIKTSYKPELANLEFQKQEKNFLAAADENKRSSNTWRIILAILLGILILVSWWFITTCWKDGCRILTTNAEQITEFSKALFYTDLAKNIVIRLFLLSILVLLIKYAMKHYNALMHNYTINTHKASSLNAAMRIFDSISNETTREIVIQTAAKEIFTQQKTGYLTKEGEKIDLNIIEKLSTIFNK